MVMGCTLIFFAAALLYVSLQKPVYTASATLSVRLEEGTGAAENFSEILSGLQDTQAARGLVVEEAAHRAGWRRQADFNNRLSWEPTSSDQVEVSFTARTPEAAAQAANAYADVVVERVRELKRRLVGGTVAVNAKVKKPAKTPQRRTGAKVLIVAISVGCGLLVGGTGALILEGRARRWHGSKDAELTLRAPVLGVIPDYSNDRSDTSLHPSGSAK